MPSAFVSRLPSTLRATLLAPASLLGAAVFLVYVVTLLPGVPGGDGGEIAGVLATGGVIHPSGYPLYALLGGLFAHLPFGSVAFDLNLMSAACDASAAGVLYLAVSRLRASRPAGLAAALLFAFAPGVWRYATITEVFALNNLFIACLILVAVRWSAERDERLLRIGAVVFGLGLCNHATVLFTGAPLAAWTLWTGRRELLRPRVLLRLAGFFAAGLLPYLDLPIAAARHAAITWGAADTWSGFWTHVLRREYGTFSLAAASVSAHVTAGDTLTVWAHDLVEQIGPWGIGLALLGVIVSLRGARSRSLPLALLAPPSLSLGVLAFLGNLPLDTPLFRGILARFWQQPDIYVFVWCGVAVGAAARFLTERYTLAVAAGIGLVQLSLHAREMDRHESTLVRCYGEEILRVAPKGALLLTKGDLITNTVRYLQAAEGVRPDLRIVDQELLGFDWMRPLLARQHPEVVVPPGLYAPGEPGGFDMKQLLDANFGHEPIVVCGGVKEADSSADATYAQWPMGLCALVHRGDERVNVEAWLHDSDAALPQIDFDGEAHPEGSWEDVVWQDYWDARVARGVHLMNLAGRDEARRGYLIVAGNILDGLAKENPSLPPRFYKVRAMAIGRAGLDTPAQKARAADAWRDYLRVAPPDEPGTAAIRDEVRRLTQ